MVRVLVPRDSSARSVGADEVAAAIAAAAAARGTAVDLVRTGSRGLYWLEPLVEVEIETNRIGYGPVSAQDVESLFAAGFLDGAEHPLRVGRPEDLPYLREQERITFARCGLIDPLSLTEYVDHGGFAGLQRALAIGPDRIIEEVTDSGLRGRGGAGFPTGRKWRTARETEADRRFIVCNADEGDSGNFADRMLLEGDPFSIVEGMVIAAFAVGADHGYVYIRSEYPDAVEVMGTAIAAAREAGYLGEDIAGSGHAFDIEIRVGAGSYVCGEETALLESIEGRRGIVRAKPPYPATSGLWGRPTVVNNVVSLATVPFILDGGAQHYASLGSGTSRGTLPVQLSGTVARPGLIETPLGLPIRRYVEDFGGGSGTERAVRAVQVGGPLGAFFPPSLFDTALDYEALDTAGGILGHGSIVVFDETADMARLARSAMEFCALESCGKCTPCRIGSTRAVELIDRITAGEERDFSFQLLSDLCEVMRDASLCALGGFAPFPVESAVRYFPEDFERPGAPAPRTEEGS